MNPCKLSYSIKKALVATVMGRLGVCLGENLAPRVIHWFANVQLIRITTVGNLEPYYSFGLGCGVLFAMAALAGRSWLGRMGCLLFGIAASAAAARIYYAGYASSFIPMISDYELPLFRIPMIGAFAILCAAALPRLLATRSRVVSIPK